MSHLRPTSGPSLRAVAAAALACALSACDTDGTGPPSELGFRTAQPAQAVGLGTATVTPILTVGDTLPGGFIFAPKPDGLGGYVEGGRLILFSNHELSQAGVTGTDGTPKFTYARVSRLVLDRSSATVLGGSYLLDPAGLYRNLCSATYADASVGFPGGWFLTGEEATGTGHDGVQLAVSKAGQVVEMPWIGRFAHENLVSIPGFSGRVVLAGMDDTRGRSELYLYVAANESQVLAGQGTLYVFTSGASNVGQLTAGQAIDGRFVAVPNAASLSSAQLQTTVDGLGAFKFAGLEDGDFDRRAGLAAPAFYFVDTGSGTAPTATAPWDPYGSIYRIIFDAADPTRARLTLLARSPGPAGSWASPDNVSTSQRSLMVQEDPAHNDWARRARIWRFPLNLDGTLGTPQAVAEVLDPSCIRTEGLCWESSGIVNASAWLGEGTWLFDVQAHPEPEPRLGLTRDAGQLLTLRVPGS